MINYSLDLACFHRSTFPQEDNRGEGGGSSLSMDCELRIIILDGLLDSFEFEGGGFCCYVSAAASQA